MSLLDWALLLALSLLWGGSFFFVGVAVIVLPPFTIVLLRVAIAALALHLVLRLTGTAMPWDGRIWLAFFGMGLLNNVIPFSLIAWGQTHIASGLPRSSTRRRLSSPSSSRMFSHRTSDCRRAALPACSSALPALLC
jgi:hypothetical protein